MVAGSYLVKGDAAILAHKTKFESKHGRNSRKTQGHLLVTSHVTVKQELELINKISNFTKLKRIMAYVKRFTNNCRNVNKQTGPLSTTELNDANNSIMKLLQENSWSPELRLLRAGRAIKIAH
jgi:hypothetical protein